MKIADRAPRAAHISCGPRAAHFFRGPRAASESIACALVTLAAALAVQFAPRPTFAAEPPAIVVPPELPAKAIEPRQFLFEASFQEVWTTMGEWHDGIADLEARARQSGLEITTSNNPGYTTSFEAAGLISARGPILLGVQYDRITGKSEFDVHERIGFGAGSAQYETVAEATSNAYLLVGRWMIPGARRGVRPFVQLGAGVGSARLAFSTSGATAEGKGHAFAGTLEAGIHVGNGPLRVRAGAGYRSHRVPLSYSRVLASSLPGVQRYFFDFNDELGAFVSGRDVDLGGAFARLGLAVALAR